MRIQQAISAAAPMSPRSDRRRSRRLSRVILPCVVLSLVLGAADAARAQTEMVVDLRTGVGDDSSRPFPAPLLGAVGDAGPFYFWAEGDGAGRELWRTDGSTAGTRRVTDICPGPCDARQELDPATEVHWTTLAGGPLLTFADDGATGDQLWRIDEGTDAASTTVERLTSLCTGTTPCSQSVGFADFVLADGRVTFSVRGGASAGIWATDGTPGGTGPLWDAAAPTQAHSFVRLGDDVYFAAAGDLGWELYRTDLFGAAPTLAVDVCPGSGLVSYRELTKVGNRIVFESDCGGGTAQWWSTRGTPGSTMPLAPTCFGPCDEFFRTAFSGGRFYFGAGPSLWSTDGTPGGTRRAADLGGRELRGGLEPVGGGVAFFLGQADFSGDPTLHWVDGDFGAANAPRSLGVTGWHTYRASGGDRLLLTGPPFPGPSVVLTDGTVAGTVSADLEASRPTELAAVGDRFYFRGQSPDTGLELWTIPPGADSDELVADLAGAVAGSTVRQLVDRGPDTLFTTSGDDYGAREIWTTDGTAAGTSRIRGSDPEADLLSIRDWSLEMHVFDQVAFFGADGGTGVEPWTWDGGGNQADGAVLLADLAPDDAIDFRRTDSFPRDPVRFGDLVYFFADQGDGEKIWTTDLTTDGTELLIDIDPAWFNHRNGCPVCSPPDPYPTLYLPLYPRGLTALDDVMVFAAYTEEHGGELWRSDGTAEGTELLVDLLPGLDPFDPESSEPTNFRRVGPWVYFLARGADQGPLPYSYQRTTDVWRTDGTVEGTTSLVRLPVAWPRVADENRLIQQVVFGSTPSGAKMALATPGSANLWIFDAGGGVTAIGLPRSPSFLAPAGDRLYFVSGDAEEGTELWYTDGTIQGTQRIVVRPGPLGSSPTSLVLRDTADERALYFGAVGDFGPTRRGHELWRLPLGESYLPAGLPHLAADINPGPDSSAPSQITVGTKDGILLFEADDGVHGRELWRHLPGADPGACVPDDHTACVGDRFRLSVTFRDGTLGPPQRAQAVPRSAAPDTDDTVFFTFFSDANLELALKVLDGTPINGHHWLYYGALSDVPYTITAEDLATGVVRVVDNEPGNLCGGGDVIAFPEPPSGASIAADEQIAVRGPRTDHPPPGACRDLPGTLCFYDRFEVRVDWATDDDAGAATPIPFSEETGLFWFFGEDNVELAVKVLDGTPINGKYWVYYGALSDVAYTMTVYDTWTDQTRVYENEAGNLCGGADVGAF